MSKRYTHWITELTKAEAHVERLTAELLRKATLLAKWREQRDRAKAHVERLERENEERNAARVARNRGEPYGGIPAEAIVATVDELVREPEYPGHPVHSPNVEE